MYLVQEVSDGMLLLIFVNPYSSFNGIYLHLTTIKTILDK